MNCPNCHEPVETDAAYCGNCGQGMRSKAKILGSVSVAKAVPAYAMTSPWQHAGEVQSLVSVLLGAVGLAGSMFVPMLGLAFGLFGIAVATSTRVTAKRAVRTAGLVLSGLAVLAGLATWAHAVRSDPRFNPSISKATPASSTTRSAADFSTPCYSLSFIDQLNIDQGRADCDINAYNGHTLATSTNAYKVYSSKSDVTTANDFANRARQAIDKDAAESLTGFHVDSEKVSSFAGSPAYVLNASDQLSNVSIIEAAVFHKVSNGDNIFILVHANNGPSADLQIMESSWQWK